jgi:hypothetical protein
MTFVAVSFLIRCTGSNQLTPEQEKSLKEMKTTYNKAKLFNDSLTGRNGLAISNTLKMKYYDSCYHVNSTIFNNSLEALINKQTEMNGMTNSNKSIITANGDIMKGGNMSKCCTVKVNDLLKKMNELKERHKSVHP